MAASLTLHFEHPPGIWGNYSRVVTGRKPRAMPPGAMVPRIEATLAPIRIDPGHLARYAAICGVPRTDVVPIAFPHMLASGMHLAMLSSRAFPVSVLGIVHLQNRIVRRHAQDPAQPIALRSWIEGHRDTELGHEFELETEGTAGGEVIWQETCTFLARGARAPRARVLAAERARERERERAAAADSEPLHASRFAAPAGLGRRYAAVSGDYNPIHLGDLVAKPFGFRKAIAHGMWSLARCAAEAGEADVAGPVTLDVAFKTPVFMPADLLFESRAGQGTVLFSMKDASSDKPYLNGELRTAAA